MVNLKNCSTKYRCFVLPDVQEIDSIFKMSFEVYTDLKTTDLYVLCFFAQNIYHICLPGGEISDFGQNEGC